MSEQCIVYLTRRNLLSLLNKLNRNRHCKKQVSACTIIKMDRKHPEYPIQHPVVVKALENEEYYTDRTAGDVHNLDQPTLEQLENSEDDNYLTLTFEK